MGVNREEAEVFWYDSSVFAYSFAIDEKTPVVCQHSHLIVSHGRRLRATAAKQN
jgi:hypothetical protein